MLNFENVRRGLRPIMPFTALNTVWRFLDKGAQSILDIGCGEGEPMKFINRRKWFYTVGLDVFKPYLLKAKREETHDDYVLCDVTYTPVKEKAFDVVIAIEVLEHLTREDGVKLLKKNGKISS